MHRWVPMHRQPYRIGRSTMPLVRSEVSPRRRKYLDIMERVFWTAVQAASAVGIVDFFEWEAKWIAPLAIGIAILKSVAGTAIGNTSTGSTLPAEYDPATPPVAPVIADDGGHADLTTVLIALACAIVVVTVYAVAVV